jgi:stage III sporulation protein SpoIIIAA
MGNFFGGLFSKLWSKKEIKIIIIGLDNSGKTTILSTSVPIQTNCISTKLSRQYQVHLFGFSYRIQYGSRSV